MDYWELFDPFLELLSQSVNNGFIGIDESDLKENHAEKIDLLTKTQASISPKILHYYQQITFHETIWTYKKNKEIRGFINILPLADSLKDNFMKDFRMLDMFVPEACVGYYLAKAGLKPNDELYFLYFEDEPQGLNVDMEGYIQLLYMARGFGYWQRCLLWLQGNPEGDTAAVEEFKTWMPKVFPDFKWAEFVALYERVKLK